MTGARITGEVTTGFNFQQGYELFSSPLLLDRLWAQPSLLSNDYRGLLPRG
jgi:hypothetical protein